MLDQRLGLNVGLVLGLSLDLDDTLWPVWPAIERAEAQLRHWLGEHAPMTAALFANADAIADVRAHVLKTRPELKHDLSAVRREAIRTALYRSGENPLLAEQAFAVFFAARNRVDLYADALPALTRLGAKYPLVSLSNGNADLKLVGIDRLFKAQLSAKSVGVGKPHAQAFLAAADALRMKPERVLHVGDDWALDVQGAIAVGMQTVWVNRQGLPTPSGARAHATVSDLLELAKLLGC